MWPPLLSTAAMILSRPTAFASSLANSVSAFPFLKSDEPVMLDGMLFEELQSQFEVPLYAFDFAGLAEMLESISSEPVPAREPQATTIGA